MKDQREAVMTRIKEALRVPAPHRHAATHAQPAGNGVAGQTADDGLPSLASFRSWLPVVGPRYEDQIRLFSQNSAQLKTEVILVKSAADVSQGISKLAQEGNWKRLASHLAENVLLSAVQKQVALDFVGEPMLFTDKAYDIAALESVDAAITGCEVLVAQTGSILVTNHSSGGRALSVLAPHHIVVATADQMVPDLSAAFEILRARYENKWPSFISFITGPSRTGDIERILVLGAHGPKRLTVYILE